MPSVITGRISAVTRVVAVFGFSGVLSPRTGVALAGSESLWQEVVNISGCGGPRFAFSYQLRSVRGLPVGARPAARREVRT